MKACKHLEQDVSGVKEGRYSIDLHNDYAELQRMTQWLHGITEGYDFPQEVAFGLDLCLYELVTNIINYGYDDHDSHSIVIRLVVVCSEGELNVKLEDNGKAFNPLEHPSPPRFKTLETAEVGGLGIELVRRYTNCLEYERYEGRNLLTFSMKIGKK